MRLAAVIFALVLAGCRPTIDYPDVSADLACEAAYAILRLRSEIAPTPQPANDKCERCDGTGVIGDRASIRITCPDCKGTGKKLKSVLVCPDGKCSQ